MQKALGYKHSPILAKSKPLWESLNDFILILWDYIGNLGFHINKINVLPTQNRQNRLFIAGKCGTWDERAGVANVFMLFVPLEGKRHVSVRKRRTAKDYAEVVRELVDVHFPLAEKIILVNDNLNTHKIGDLYLKVPQI